MAGTGSLLLLMIVSCCSARELQKQNISDKCMRDTNSFLWELNQDHPKEYAVVMYDSFGKMGSNVIGGNINQPGLMSECRSAHTDSFSGQYCQVSLRQGEVFYFVAICVPNSCKDTEVHTLVLEGTLKFGEISLIPPLPSVLVNNSMQDVVETHCLSNNVDPDAFGIACLVLCCVLVAVPLAATLITAVKNEQLRRKVPPAMEPSSVVEGQTYGDLKMNDSLNCGTNDSSLHEDDQNKTRQQSFLSRCLQQFLQAFSLQTTTQEILSTSVKGAYLSLNGVRALSMLWIISGHTPHLIPKNYIDNNNIFQASLLTNLLHLFTAVQSSYLAVDSFLLLSGLLSAKSLLSSIQRNDDTMSLGLVADYFFKRIRRIQPLHMFVLSLSVGFTSVFNGGPYREILRQQCDKYWWTNLLLINNLFDISLSCLPWTWYLSLDFQCYATTPLLILAYRKNKVVFAVLVVALLLMTILSGSIMASYVRTFNDFLFTYYYKPYSRYGPFLIGILFAIYLTSRKETFLKKKWQVALGWICSMSALVLVVVLGRPFLDMPDHTLASYCIYQGMHRVVWAMSLTWFILACEEGYGGFIMSLLSLRFWVPLSNLSYACYIIHPFVAQIYVGLQETPIHYLDINFMYLFLGQTVLTVVLSYFVTVLVERPFVLLKWK